MFYRDTLDLGLVDENPFALVLDLNGTMLRVTKVEEVEPRPYTVLGWEVADVTSMAQQLRDANVELNLYPGMDQDALGIWTAPGGAKVAWFNDPEGNVLSVAEA